MQTRSQRKAELMKQLEEAVGRILDWQEAHQTCTLTELEDFVLSIRREMGQEVANLLMGGMASKVILGGVRGETCGDPLIYKGLETKQMETRIGELEVERGRYWCPTCQEGLFPPG